MDFGILDTLHVDPYGNINSTALGDYNGEHRRFGGPGGADSIAALSWKTILMTDQQARKFVPPRRLHLLPWLPRRHRGRPRARRPAARHPSPARRHPRGPLRLRDRYLRLIGVSPFVTVD